MPDDDTMSDSGQGRTSHEVRGCKLHRYFPKSGRTSCGCVDGNDGQIDFVPHHGRIPYGMRGCK